MPKSLLIILSLFVLVPVGLSAEPMTVGVLIGMSGLGDQSFNDMIYAGVIKAKQEHGIKIVVEDPEKNPAAFDESMHRLLLRNSSIIVAAGFYFIEVVEKYAKLYPDRYFIIHDAHLEGLPNVVSTEFAVREGSFLVGALAAMQTRSGRIGFIGGVDTPIMHEFRIGFEKGARFADPQTETIIAFVTKAPDYSGFSDPARGYEMALSQYAKGADIIYSAAGLTGNGVMQAAKKMNRFAIGVDSDQDHMAKGHILTSMMKRLDIVTHKELSEIIAGRFQAGIKRYGLKQGGIGLTPMKYTHHLISPKVLDRLADIKRRIIDGQIAIPSAAIGS